MKWCSGLFVLGLCCVIQDGRGQTDQTDHRLRYREKQRQRLAELSRATTSFGVSLYRRLAAQSDNKNVVFSPFSVFTALSMTLLGADGKTKDELRTVMSQRPRQGVHQALRAIMDSFPRDPRNNVTLRVANTLYYDRQQLSLNDGFLRSVRRHYGAYPQVMERPEPETPINDWIFRQTGGKISDFFGPGEITADMVMILLNAVYFQGTWKDVFNKRFTNEDDFTTASGQTVRVSMMSRDGDYSVKSLGPDIRARVLELPFGTDDRFSMFVLLPEDVDGLPELESRLDPQMLDDALSSMPQGARFSVQLPKFTLRVKTSLTEILRTMGITRLFSGSADLSRMTPNRVAVNAVKHEAVIEVDETGATAAAVTAVTVVGVSLSPSFRVDHPFLLVLRDKKARLNLFMGRVNDPSSEE